MTLKELKQQLDHLAPNQDIEIKIGLEHQYHCMTADEYEFLLHKIKKAERHDNVIVLCIEDIDQDNLYDNSDE